MNNQIKTQTKISDVWEAPLFHLFDVSEDVRGLMILEGSRVYSLSSMMANELQLVSDNHRPSFDLKRLGIGASVSEPRTSKRDFPLRTLSLAISQQCNLGCTYCYASGGSFGRAPTVMTNQVAEGAVLFLIDQLPDGDTGTLAFMGGEPLVNSKLVRSITEFAHQKALAFGKKMEFSITTNGTLISQADLDTFRNFGFTVTVSLDGVEDAHDLLRPYKGGRGSYAKIVENIGPLLDDPGSAQIHARATVSANSSKIRETIDGLTKVGFTSIGFSPMVKSPNGKGELDQNGMDELLDQFIECGKICEAQALEGKLFPFSNFLTAIKMIHLGAEQDYSCGAGLGYLAVSADGELSACHRFVGDEAGAMGDIVAGIDSSATARWRDERHVDAQEPCETCWAKNMCGGGCHHEVLGRGRITCDFIRGWLDYCLGAYLRLSNSSPLVLEQLVGR